MEYDAMLINGRWTGASSAGVWVLINPATEEPIGEVAFGDRTDAEAAIDAASGALEGWKAMGPYKRARILEDAADLLSSRAGDLGALTSEESGKPLGQAIAEWKSAPSYLRFAAEEAKRIGGRIIPASAPGKRIEVTYHPVGVVGVIAAWNFPVYNVNRSVSSALAAGCTVVARPSEYTPRSAFAYAAALHDAGVPAGVLNVINGDPESMAQAMLDDPRVRKIQFTGSARVGKLLMDGASKTVTQLSLELGGNAPVIVMPDVRDLEAVAASAVTAKYRNSGQVCISPQRFFVHESIVQRFSEVVKAGSSALSVGDPMDTTTDVGPLINATQRDRVEALVGAAVDGGANVDIGGRRMDGVGFFYEPTVLSGDIAETVVMREEIFGPVLPIIPFSDIDSAVDLANNVEHGLTGFVWTSDLGTAISVADRLEYGMVGINDWYPVTAQAPFGGVKQSGIGRESGTEGLMEYLEPKTRFYGGLV
ncbi:MAG: NAD-dependent succinate-semialdehyde dehydrogenase [Acidimicrobiia bacterium]|nr:NAD-dependent succinate-semialdehyde dehydrogenase [Acidimicrobiia bacterium]